MKRAVFGPQYENCFKKTLADFVGLCSGGGELVFSYEETQQFLLGKTFEKMVEQEQPLLWTAPPMMLLNIVEKEAGNEWMHARLEEHAATIREHERLCYPPTIASWCGEVVYWAMSEANEGFGYVFERNTLREIAEAFPDGHLKPMQYVVEQLFGARDGDAK